MNRSPRREAHLGRRDGVLHVEDVSLPDIASRFDTPCYIYSRAAIERRWHAYDAALSPLPHRICYSVKACSNLAVLDALARLGSGFDIVSGGELARVLAAGADPAKVVFSGVGKTGEEMRRALATGIASINVESTGELDVLEQVAAAAGCRAPVALRINPDVDAKTHPYISTGLRENKFGVPIAEAPALYRRIAASPHLEPVGADCHIGSQLLALAPVGEAVGRIVALIDALAADGIRLRHLNVGGGIGIRYRDETPPDIEEYAALIRSCVGSRALEVLVEPGRAIVGEAGLLLTRVLYDKVNGEKRFAVVDAAMNDLIRPALYGAWQEIVEVDPRGAAVETVDVVGPVCESADFLGKDRALAAPPGALLAVLGAGAYAFAMSSNYNTRPRPPEILVDGRHCHLARRRERVEDLFADERCLPPA